MKNKSSQLLILAFLLSLVFAISGCGENTDTNMGTNTETGTQTELNTDTDTEDVPSSDTDTESDTSVESDTNTATDSETDTRTEIESNTDTDSETDTETETNTDTDTETETDTDTEPDEPEHVHTEEIIAGVEPTCTETGLTEGKKCSVCGEVLVEQEELPAQHTYKNSYACFLCGYISANESVGLSFELNTETNTYIVTGIGSCQDSDIVIPYVYDNRTVTSIGSEAFWNCISLTSIVIPDSVTSIGTNAFYNCSSLIYNEYDSAYYLGNESNPYLWLIKAKDTKITSCTINENTKSIGNYAFDDCTLLTSVTIGDSVTSMGYRAFGGCTSLTSVTIGDSVTSIGTRAFEGCTSLTSIVIPNSVTSIEEAAFDYCHSLTSVNYLGTIEEWCNISFRNNPLIKAESLYLDGKLVTNLVIPDTVTEIKDEVFRGCNSLTSVTIPNSVTSIGYDAFRDCTSLTSVTIPDSVTSIGYDVFQGCTSLASVTIGNSVTNIGNYAFYGCNSLTSIVIPNSVTSIDYRAFQYCSSLTSITIGNGITSIGKYAFQYCSSLESVNYLGSIEDWCNISFEDDSSNPLNNIASLYLNGELITNLVIPDTVTQIKNDAFYGCNSLTSIVIPNSVTSIDNEAFRKCTSLTSIAIGNGVTSIGNSAFSGCTSLTRVTIGDNVTSIGNGAFAGCTSLTSITIPDSVTSIGNDAFPYCRSLTSVTIGDSVTSIGNEAFRDCSSLTSIVIPDSVTSIGTNAFEHCYKLVEVYNLSGLNITAGSSNNGDIGYYAKVIHTSLDEESILETVDDYIFMNWEDKYYLMGYVGNDTELTLPESYNGNNYEIYHYAFWRDDVTKVTIPNGVTSIGYGAFYNCTGLTSVTFEDANGWYVTSTEGATSGTYVDLSDSLANATYLTNTYDNYYWYKK